ncbi:DNA polymerase III subunit gamma/tau [Euzebya tangerina]|uniref:DNA polymerase III subunit gamma/tau n=1 Tax=Euzebya tangerina TaxID=591198 RepID=UPI0013C3103C|nr:DNA polymerase III subunit gamma/tau [Euzebya tangerina]
MAHVSLYRKYRPQTFDEVVGQDHVTTTLARAVDSGSWHHAYLFTGPRGTGKTSSARLLAMAINATDGPTSTPPADDPIVTAIREGTCPDVIEIDAASNNGVDDVRDLRERVAFSPAQARVKVYIVDECHMLSNAAWNAFLKTIEEPPDHVVFVFATTEPHKVLPTVLSRTQRFDLRRIPAAELADHCRHIADLEGFTFEGDALQSIVRAGDGSARDTLSVLDQVVAFTGPTVTAAGVAEVLGSVPAVLLDRLAGLLADSDVAGVLGLVQEVADGGTDLRQFATDAVEHLRSLLLLAAAPEAGLVDATPDRVAELTAQASRTGPADLLRAVELLNDAQPKMRRGNTQLPLEIALAKAALPESGGDPEALAARLDRVESALSEWPAAAAAPAGASAAPAGDEPDRSAREAPATDRGPDHDPSDAAPDEPEPSEPSRSAPGQSEPSESEPRQSEPRQSEPKPEGPEAVEPGAAAADPVAPTGPSTAPDQDAGPAAADSAPEPAPQESASDTPDPVDDLTRIIDAWPAVLTTLGRTSKRVSAVVGEGRPTSITGDALMLHFPFEFHAEQARDAETAQAIGAAVEAVTGTRYRINAVVGSDPPAASVEVVDDEASAVINHEAAEAAGDVADDDEAHDQAIAALSQGLGATVISDSRE